MNMTSRIIAKLACWSHDFMEKTDLQFYLTWLKDQLKLSVSSKHLFRNIIYVLMLMYFKLYDLRKRNEFVKKEILCYTLLICCLAFILIECVCTIQVMGFHCRTFFSFPPTIYRSIIYN